MPDSSKFLTKKDLDLRKNAMTSDCINKFITYLNNSGFFTPNIINKQNVIASLIIYMSQKRGLTNLSDTNITNVEKILNNTIVSREKLLAELQKWSPKPLKPISGPQGRQLLTMTTSLANATKMSVNVIKKTYIPYWKGPESKTITPVPLNKAEIDLINKVDSQKKTPPNPIASGGTKLWCGICWICENPIYMYKIKRGTKVRSATKCGEDEHILPPGSGNLFGLLYENFDKTKKNMGDLVGMGLRPSHAWCNQCKKDWQLITPPTVDAPSYSLNQDSLDKIINKIDEPGGWGYSPIFSYSYEKNFDPSNPPNNIINNLVPQIKNSIPKFIGEICKEANTWENGIKPASGWVGNLLNQVISWLKPPNKTDAYIMFKLRMIFNGCIIVAMIHESIQQNWKGGNRPPPPDDDDLYITPELDEDDPNSDLNNLLNNSYITPDTDTNTILLSDIMYTGVNKMTVQMKLTNEYYCINYYPRKIIIHLLQIIINI